MYLAIDPSLDNKIKFLLFTSEDKESTRIYEARSSDFLGKLDDFLNRNSVHLQDLKGIGVVVGEGRFTSTRIAVVIVNTIKFVLNKYLAVLSKKDIQDKNTIIKKINSQQDKYISAQYSGEPNIN